jgi:hypothetical protein
LLGFLLYTYRDMPYKYIYMASLLGSSLRAFDDLSGNFTDILGYTNEISPVNRSTVSGLCYPLEILSSSIDFSKEPLIVFYCNGRKNSYFGKAPTYIAFPIPIGLNFTDGSQYDDTSLGAVGSTLARGVGAVAGSANASDAMGRVANVASNAYNQSKSASISDIVAQVVDKFGIGEGVKNIASVGLQTVVNPNVVSEFNGVGTRSFSFSFKMIASSQKEADMIKQICHTLRLGLYPEGNAISLRYPPTWTIRFMLNNRDIEYIPKIFESYLTSVTVGYNPSNHAWHTDGSPLECDLQVSFKETRALTAEDIDKLDKSNINNIKYQAYVAPQREATLDADEFVEGVGQFFSGPPVQPVAPPEL